MMGGFHELTVLSTRSEIGGAAKTIVFDVPQAMSPQFKWQAGQHLSLRFTLDGKELRRSYSISNSPHAPQALQVTVKRVPGGHVSNHINDALNAGDKVGVMPPFGQFYLTPEQDLRRTHYFFAAGSGITPLFAMLHSVLLAEPWSDVRLLYGNKSADSILFRDALAGLAQGYAGRLEVRHVLSEPSIWSGFRYWRRGRIDAAAIVDFIRELPPYAQDAQYYISGPDGMNLASRRSLMSVDVPATRIQSESFGGTESTPSNVSGVAATAHIELSRQTHVVEIEAGQTVLEASLKAGITPPFSCQSGVCGACQAKLLSGSATMRSRMALSDDDIAGGRVLACQALAQTPDLALKFE